MSIRTSLYYQAYVRPQDAWFVVGVLKSYEHMAFDRTLDKEQSIFEFFVPVDMQPLFQEVTAVLEQRGMLMQMQQLPNRLCNTID